MSAFRKGGKSSLAEALMNVKDSSASVSDSFQYKKASEGDFTAKLDGFIKEIESKYRDGMSLSAEVAKIAERDNLTEDEINRVVQAVNMRIYQMMYEKTVGKEDRTVNFDIADPGEVRRIMGKDPETVQAAVESGAPEGEEKVAGEKLNMASALIGYNPEGRDRDYAAPAIKNFFKEYLFEKVAENIVSDIEKAAALESEIDDGIKTLGLCFAKYASHGLDHQEIFNRTCVRAGLRKSGQLLVKEAFETMKGAFKVAEDTSLELFDIDGYKDFSLGKHSISKIAEEGVATLPEVVDKKRQIRDFERLVDIAMKIQADDELLNSVNEKIEAKKQLVDVNDTNPEEENVQ